MRRKEWSIRGPAKRSLPHGASNEHISIFEHEIEDGGLKGKGLGLSVSQGACQFTER
jgi:hypothetical protein